MGIVRVTVRAHAKEAVDMDALVLALVVICLLDSNHGNKRQHTTMEGWCI